MTQKECQQIGKAFAQEMYRLYTEKGVPETDYVSVDEAARILGRSKRWLYNQGDKIPHANRRYSKTVLIAYMNR